MTDVRPQAVIDNAREYLQTEITDPNSDRNGSTRFVYTIPINFDLADFPRIHVQRLSGAHAGFSLGTANRQVNELVQFSIFHSTQDGYNLDIDGDGELESAEQVVDFLSERIVDLINESQSRWRGLGDNVQYFITQNENRIQDSQNHVIHYSIDAELRLTR
jgi:hypothetical protein